MAYTYEQVISALRNADAAGDVEAAKRLAGIARGLRQQQTPSAVSQIPMEPGYVPQQPQQQQPEPSLIEKVKGAGESALSMITGATGGALGTVVGTGEGIVKSVQEGTFGTQEGVKTAEKAAMERAGQFTYQPRTEQGKKYTQEAGEFLQDALPPVLPLVGTSPQLASAATRQAVTGAKQAVQQGATTAKNAGVALSARVAALKDVPIIRRGSVGAASTPDALRRTTIAESMPVPFTGKSGLTAGQATRNFDQLKFEKEMAKQELGQPIRERILNQTETLNQNFDAFIDNDSLGGQATRATGVAVSEGVLAPELLGKAVDKAVKNRAEAIKTRIRNLYKQADEKGETSAPVDMSPLSSFLNESINYEGSSPNISAIKREGLRLGILKEQDGKVVASAYPAISIKDAEVLRKFANKVTNWSDPQQAMFAKQIVHAIDDATEGAGGNIYKEARKLRHSYANEFQNQSLTKKLLGTKRGTDERQIAFEDVFDKVILSSSKEEMNKLRSTLLKGGDEGKQAWIDLKTAAMDYIKESSLSTQRDERGNFTIVPSKLSKTIKALDAEGKLESLYGKKRAQQIRDLSELANDIYTAPPGAVNFSNTASALSVALDSFAGYSVSGLPAPFITMIREGSKYVKNRSVRKRIEKSLEEQGQQSKSAQVI